MMPYWTIVQTASAWEKAVLKGLQCRGFETYLPVTSVRDRKRDPIIVPLFPCYLFVWVVDRWTPIASTLGVVRVLRDGDTPARLSDRVIDELRAREVNGIVRLPPLRSGQSVRLVRGAFRGQSAIYQGMSGRDRVRVLLTALGRQVTAVVRADDAVAY
jgi:transcriptional antiterminator RfaH